MSYILDALKKLENEKASKNRGTGMLSISGELFKEERRSPSGGNFWKIAAVVVFVSLVTFGVTWFFLKADQSRDGVKQLPASTARPVSPQVLPVDPSRQPISSTTTQAPVVTPPAPASVTQTVAPVVPVVKVAVPAAAEQRVKRKNMPKKQPALAAQKLPPLVPTNPPPADIKVSGIAWQDEHGARRAVVNGFLVQEGGNVSGAKIVEIFQDRVRFSQDGRIFEVYLLASGLPGTVK